jgi:hypothetical protein
LAGQKVSLYNETCKNRQLTRVYDSPERQMPIRADLLAEQTPTVHRFDKLVKRYGKIAVRITQIGWVSVFLAGRDEHLTLVVSRLAGVDKPMMLLTNPPVDNPVGRKMHIASAHTQMGMRGGNSLSQQSCQP